MAAWAKLHQPNNSQNWNSCARSGHVLARKTSHCRAVEFCLLIIAHSRHSVHCKFGVCVVWEWWCALIRASLLGLNSEGASAWLPFQWQLSKVCVLLFIQNGSRIRNFFLVSIVSGFTTSRQNVNRQRVLNQTCYHVIVKTLPYGMYYYAHRTH